jgi:hypothetical protein
VGVIGSFETIHGRLLGGRFGFYRHVVNIWWARTQ